MNNENEKNFQQKLKKQDAKKYTAETGDTTIWEGKETGSETIRRANAVLKRLQEEFEKSGQLDGLGQKIVKEIPDEMEQEKKTFNEKYQNLKSQAEDILVEASLELKELLSGIKITEKVGGGYSNIINTELKPLLDQINFIEQASYKLKPAPERKV